MTQPIRLKPPPRKFRLPRSISDSKAQEDRSFRQNQDRYAQQGLEPKEAEAQAQIDFDITQQLKKKRGLKGITLDQRDQY